MTHKGTYVRLNSLNLSSYEISQTGDVRHISSKHSLTHQVNQAGIRNVGLIDDSHKRVTYSVAKLVLMGYVGESSDPKKKYILHKDGDRNNAKLSNLKWATKSTVIRYMKSYSQALDNPQYLNVQIKETNTGNVYTNSLEASAVTGVAPTDIYHLAIGYNMPDVPSQGFKFVAVNY